MMMICIRCKKPTAVLAMCLLYGLISLFSAYTMIKKHETTQRSWKLAHQTEGAQNLKQGLFDYSPPIQSLKQPTNLTAQQLEIWDTSGVGIYLWKHVLQGDLPDLGHDGWFESALKVAGLQIRYKLGYGLRPEDSPSYLSKNMFLVLNGRDLKVVEHAKAWLDYVLSSSQIKNLGLILLGDESCDNKWLQQYLTNDVIKLIYLIYDSPLIDNKRIFSWPLGVASYRNFPAVHPGTVDITGKRRYICNFIGTTYAKSSREDLMTFVKQEPYFNNDNCIFKWRKRWTEEESIEDTVSYQHFLMNSDLTLSPVGKNAECYRTYEAIELGSIPVIEDIPTPAQCNRSNLTGVTSPYRVLKEHKAPVIFIKDWRSELPDILRKFNALAISEKVRLRSNLLRWYTNFKNNMKAKFIENLRDLFNWKA